MPVIGKRARFAAVSALAALALALTACSGDSGTGDTDAVNTVDGGTASSIESAVATAMELSQSTSAVVGVWQGEGSAFVQGFGDGVGANAAIRAAQASQPVVCAALLELVDEGALTLTRELSKDMPRQVGIDGITYGELCTAQSGLGNYSSGLTDIFANNPTRPWSDRELVAQGLAHSPLSWPGLDVHPNGTNALLLARSLRFATNESVADLLRARVFEKMGMASSFYPADPLNDTSLPSGGMTGLTYPLSAGAPVCDAGITEVERVSPSMLAGAGATVTTVTDLKNFYSHYLGGEWATTTRESISTANPKRDEEGNPVAAEGEDPEAVQTSSLETPFWAFGMEQVESLYGMSGSMTGTITAAYHDPETDLTVVVALNNSTAGAGFARNLAFQLAAIAGGNVTWTADDMGARLAEAVVCPPSAEEEAVE